MTGPSAPGVVPADGPLIPGVVDECSPRGVSLFSWATILLVVLVIGLPGLLVGVLVLRPLRQAPSAATITRAYDCVGTMGDPAVSLATGRKLSRGKTVALDRGLLEVTFADGARVILEERATLEISGRNGGRLLAGRLAATVPKSAHGFTIETPAATVVDLGTDFGVSVGADNTAEAHVFGGEIEVITKATPDSPAPWTGRLHEGQAARICVTDADEVARIEAIRASSDEFVRRFPVGLAAERGTRAGPSGTTKRLIVSVDRHNGFPENRAPIGLFDGETDPLPSDESGLRLGATYYSDRLYPVEQIDAPLIGAEYVRTFNTDKASGDFHYEVTFTTSRDEVFLMVLVDDRFQKARGKQRGAVDKIVSRFASPGDFVDTGYDLDIDDDQGPHPLSAFGMMVPTKDRTGKAITYTFRAARVRAFPRRLQCWNSSYVIAVMAEAPRAGESTTGDKAGNATGGPKRHTKRDQQ